MGKYQYDQAQLAGLLAAKPSTGRVFVVAGSSNANFNDIDRLFTPATVARRYSTIDAAINATTASAGDIILVAPNHTETLTTAGAIALDVAGVTVFGLGTGNNRPVITFGSTDNAATFTMSGNNTRLENIVLVCNDDGLTNGLVVSGNNCYVDVETQDTSSAIEYATAVRLDTADNCYLKIKHNGFTAGNAVVSLVRIDDCDNVKIDIDAYGVVSTAWVEMVDVASTNVSVRGRMYTQGITNFTRDVVDTVTGSTWDAIIFDSSLGGTVSGGSAAALAADDVGVVAADVTTIKGNVGGVDSATNVLGADDADNQFASTNVAANRDGSVLERLEAIYAAQADDVAANALGFDDADNVFASTNVTANRDGSILERLEAIYAAQVDDVATNFIGVDDANNVAATTNVVANGDGSILERLELLQQATPAIALDRNAGNYISVTADFTSATWNTVAAHEIATVTGMVHLVIIPEVTGAPTSAGSAATLVLGDETTTNSIIAATDAENLATGEVWFDTTDTRTLAARSIFEKTDVVVGGGKDIGYTVGTEALTGGSIVFHMWWWPISATGAVAAGAGGAL